MNQWLRRLPGVLWRHRSWWLGPLLLIVVVLGVLWLFTGGVPLGRYIYGPW